MRLTPTNYFYIVILIGITIASIMLIDTILFPLGTISKWSIDLLVALLSIVLIFYIKQYAGKGVNEAGEIGKYELSRREILILIVFLEILGIALVLIAIHISSFTG